MHDGLLMLWNCFIDFAVEHRFGCRDTEPDITRKGGGYWSYTNLIDRLIEVEYFSMIKGHQMDHFQSINRYPFTE